MSENIYKDNNGDRNLNLNLKVESLNLDLIIDEIKTYGEIKSLNIYSNDVTGTFTDYTNRSIRYQNQIKKYYIMLEKENITIKEEIEIQQRIDQLENQIFNLENSKGNLKENSDYSSLNINLKEKPSILADTNFLGIIDGVKLFLNSIDDALRFILLILGFVIPFAIIYAIYKLGRKLIK